MNNSNFTDRSSIVHLADYGGPYSGNFLASLISSNKILDRSGVKLVLVFSDIARNKAWFSQVEGDICTYTIPKIESLPALVRRIVQIAEKENAVILHTHFTTYDIAAWIAALIIQTKRKIGVIWHVHSDWPIQSTLSRRMKDLLKLRLMAGTHNTRIVAVSDGVRDGLMSRGLNQEKVEVIANGIDIVRVFKVSTSRSEMRFTHGIPDNAFVILGFGWEPQTKGVDTCIEASQALRRDGWNVRLVLVGGEQLEKFVEQYTEAASWLHVVRPRECVGDFYGIADIFFAGSRWEGFPYSVGEAMACGLPVVASDARGLSWATSCPGVVSFKLGDVNEAIRALKIVMQWSPEEREFRIRANMDLISSKYTVDTWSERVIKMYQCLTGSGD